MSCFLCYNHSNILERTTAMVVLTFISAMNNNTTWRGEAVSSGLCCRTPFSI